MKGVVVKFDAARGFGFIRSKGRADVFVHRNDVKGRRALRVGQKVRFTLQTTAKGDKAIDVVPGRAQKSPMASALAVAAAITVLVGLVAWLGFGLSPFWAYLLGVNLSTFYLYAYDKGAAMRGQLRIPENALHLLGLLGGTPAALVGQQTLRHKTRKTSFQMWFVPSVAVQVGLYLAYRALQS